MSNSSWFRSIFLLGVGFFFGTVPGYGQQRPLVTEDVVTVPSGSIRAEVGFDFEQSRNFPLSGLRGDLSRLAVVSVTAGLGSRVEVETGGVLLNHLRIDQQYRPSAIPLSITGNSTRDIGDFFFATKVRLIEEGKRRPAMGMRMGAELPNSNQARGIGLNRMSTFGTLLLGKSIGRWRLTGNLGMAIIQAPIDRFSQNDPLLYSAAAAYRWSNRVTLAGEWQGRASLRQQTPIGTESEGVVRLGTRIRAAGLTWDISALRGYHPASPRTGISVGVTYEGAFPFLSP